MDRKIFRNLILTILVLVTVLNTGAYGIDYKLENIKLREEIRRVHNYYSEGNIERIPVLAYHHIIKQEDIIRNKQEENTSILALEEFQRQMKFLYDNNFYVASLEELESYLNGEINLPKKTVVITFDDGYLSNREYAYEIMKQYNFRGQIFLITSLLDKPMNKFDKAKIQFLREGDLKEIGDVFSFHSHTHDMHRGVENHKSLLVTSSREEVRKDLARSGEILGTKYLAYPSGNHSPLVIAEAKDLGYSMAFTIAPGYVTKNTNRYKLPRFPVSSQELPFEEFKKVVYGNKLK